MQRREIEYFAAVDGVAFAVLRPGDDPLQQKTAYIVKQGDQLDLTVWARAVYGDDHVEDLLRSGYDFPPIVTDRGVATVELLAGNTPVATATVDVSPIALQGAPASIPNDDGGNVIVADGYRHSFADHHFVQPAASNPILDPWELATDNDGYRLFTEDLGAVSPVLVGDRHFLYASAFTETVEDSILVSLLSRHDSANYDWDQSAPQLHSEEAVVLAHMGPNSENLIAFDQHLVFDADTDRLWMVWGGTQIYVSEMHPQNGRLIDDPRDPEYRTHPDSIYTMVANFNGDEWTGKPEDGSEYFEGPALLEFDSTDDEYGNSFFLGDDTNQLVPGHPHFWEEDGQFYVGYDYRNRKVPGGAPEPRDIMGIRKMYFVNDWPTIWVPITVSLDTAETPLAVGKPLTIMERRVALRALFAKKHRRQRSNETPIISPAIE